VRKEMKTFNAIIASCFLGLMFAVAASAQIGGGMMRQGPMPRGLFNPVVGSGAQYEIQKGAGSDANEKKTVMEIDVVGKESVNGKDGYWLETTADSPMGAMTMKMLAAPDGPNITIAKMIMQMSGQQPMEMPTQMGRIGEQNLGTDIRDKAEKVGSESVTVPAGTFTADHYRMKDGSGDFWLSEKVSPYGLVKGQGKDFNMVLTKVITDAKDKITGTPVPFNPRLMMPGGAGGRPQQ
jgi:hypothetical protein